MSPNLAVPVCVCLCLCVPLPPAVTPASAQNVTVWLDANAAHSRPPTGTAVEAANYGLLGLRLRTDGKRSTLELGATAGRGAEAASGSWLSGRTSLHTSRVKGALDFGLRAEATGLTYLTPVRLNADDNYKQFLGSGSARPYAGVSIAGIRIGVEGMYTGGLWRSELSSPVLEQGPGLPLPGGNDVQRRTVSDDGTIALAGGSVTLLRVLGPATLELRASSYQARNQATDGRYTGIDGTLALALGPFDVTAGVRSWDTPLEGAELGGHAGLGIALGNAAYVQALASRTVSDPVFGTAGDVGLSAGVSVRLGSGTHGPPLPVSIGAPSGRGRVVRFTLQHAAAKSVAVAGDFSGWEPRALQRDAAGKWIMETVLEPGVYHYSFIIDGETWLVPDNATGIVDDGFGKKNATLVVNA